MAKKITEEDIRLNLIVNGDEGRAAILKQKEEVAKYSHEIEECTRQLEQFQKKEKHTAEDTAKIKKTEQALAQYKTRLEEAKTKLDALERQQKVETMTMEELSRHIRNTNALLKQTDRNTARWKELNEELRKAKTRMQESGTLKSMSSAGGGLVGTLGDIKVGAVAAVAAVGKVVHSLAGAVSTMANSEQANVDLSSIMGKDVSDIVRLARAALELGASTAYTSSQLTQL